MIKKSTSRLVALFLSIMFLLFVPCNAYASVNPQGAVHFKTGNSTSNEIAPHGANDTRTSYPRDGHSSTDYTKYKKWVKRQHSTWRCNY